MTTPESIIIIYNTLDGKAAMALFDKDGKIGLNPKQLEELLATSVPNINIYMSNILKDRELCKSSVVKVFLITDPCDKSFINAYEGSVKRKKHQLI